MIDFAKLWETSRAAIGFEDMKRIVEARERDMLADMGVKVGDPEALKAAYADEGVMAQLKGRQMRELLRMSREASGEAPRVPLGLAEALKRARERFA